jgi:hypothetical protein
MQSKKVAELLMVTSFSPRIFSKLLRIMLNIYNSQMIGNIMSLLPLMNLLKKSQQVS